MRTATVVFVLFAFSGVASAAHGAVKVKKAVGAPKTGGKIRKAVSAAKASGKKVNVKKVAHHIGLLAGAAEKVGAAVNSFRSSSSRRSYDDDLYARYYGDDLHARDLEEDLYARDFEEDLYARDIEEDLYVREGDGAHWARDDLFARATSEEGDYLVARGIDYDDLD